MKIKCDQCNLARIQGLVCHETGCPNSGKTWDEDREQWIKYVECFDCGYPVEVGTSCFCQNSDEDTGSVETPEDEDVEEVDTNEDSEDLEGDDFLSADFIEDWE